MTKEVALTVCVRTRKKKKKRKDKYLSQAVTAGAFEREFLDFQVSININK